MSPLSETKIEEIKSHMLHEEDALKIKYKAKNNKCDIISVPLNEVAAYEYKGFSIVKTTARKATMSKAKPTGVQFEDEVWCLFYRLGFGILNRDENLVVQWGPNSSDTQQLDVVAVNKEAIFVVECKATATPKSANFKIELNKMEQYMDGVSEALKQIYGKNKHVKFIFATKNYRFQEEGEDIIRMRNYKIFHLNDNSYSYIDNLIKSYKTTAIYQFLGLMFKDELISTESIKIPALKGKMGDKDYYLFAIEPSTLLKIGFILHRTKVNDSMAPTYQRLLVPSRLKGLTEYIDKDNGSGFFPNSIILNFADPSDTIKLTFDSVHKEKSTDAELGILHIPNAYGIAYIIDGQHRVYGYANSKYKEKHTIPVVAFHNMPSEEQLQIFMDINENQKAVSPSLRLDLEQDLYWNADRLDSRMKALRSSIIKNLANNSNNILFNMISVGEDASKLSFKPFDTALGRSGLIPKASATKWEGDTDIALYNTKETDNDKAMKVARSKITNFINGAYAIADSVMTEETKQDYLFSNRATYAFITLLGSIHSFLIKTSVINPTSQVTERIEAIKPYIEKLSESLNNLTDEEKRTIKGSLGQGADTFWLRSYQNIVNKQFPNYNPEELVEWRETQDQTLQKDGIRIKEDIRRQLRVILFHRLGMVFGAKLPSDVAILKNEVEGRIIKAFGDNDDFDMSDYDWKDYIEVPEFKSVIEKSFSYPEIQEVFAIDTGQAFKTRKEKLAWFNYITETKKKASALTRSDINRLEYINQHLQQYMIEE